MPSEFATVNPMQDLANLVGHTSSRLHCCLEWLLNSSNYRIRGVIDHDNEGEDGAINRMNDDKV